MSSWIFVVAGRRLTATTVVLANDTVVHFCSSEGRDGHPSSQNHSVKCSDGSWHVQGGEKSVHAVDGNLGEESQLILGEVHSSVVQKEQGDDEAIKDPSDLLMTSCDANFLIQNLAADQKLVVSQPIR
jgi:hypothetical protein